MMIRPLMIRYQHQGVSRASYGTVLCTSTYTAQMGLVSVIVLRHPVRRLSTLYKVWFEQEVKHSIKFEQWSFINGLCRALLVLSGQAGGFVCIVLVGQSWPK